MSQVERENQAVLALVQAMVGAVSRNFRRVSLAIVDDATQLQFVLATESEEDREEITDVAFLFESLHDHQVNVLVDVVVTPRPLFEIPSLPRVVFALRTED